MNEYDDRYKLCEEDNKNMSCKNIIIHDDIIYERKKWECGLVMKLKGCEKTALYFVKCSIFQECEYSERKKYWWRNHAMGRNNKLKFLKEQ